MTVELPPETCGSERTQTANAAASRPLPAALALSVGLALGLLGGLLAQNPAVNGGRADDPRRTPVVLAVEHSAPAVVNISTQRLVERRRAFGDSYFDQLFGGWPERGGGTSVYRTTSLGSGLIIDFDGYVLTNEHVVRRADQILVTVAGMEDPVTATLLAADPDSDLALLRIDVQHPLPWLPLGTSSDLYIGETTIAIGNPFGLASTVSVGVVSATGREVVVNGTVIYRDFLQTDASINPGNSGGPLLNILGEVIGINTAIRADGQGIGFAIPIDRVRKTIEQLSSPRRFTGAYLGVEFAERGHGLGTELTVATVDESGPGARAGLKPGDLVRRVEGEPVSNFMQLNKRLLPFPPGRQVALEVDDARGQRVARVAVEHVPLSDNERLLWERLGFVGRSLSGLEKSQGASHGYVITDVRKGSKAEELDLRRDDLFLGFLVGRRRHLIRDEGELAATVRELAPAQTVDIMIQRREALMTGSIQLE